MIFKRAYDLAIRENLLADPAFEIQPVPFIIEVDEEGRLRGGGISERRGLTTIPSTKGGELKTKQDSGKMIAIPRAHGNTASQGFARYFADTIPRVVLMSYDLAEEDEKRADELAKRGRSRETFWKQIHRAADETSDPALRAVQAFGRRLEDDTDLAVRLEQTLASHGAKPTDRCTFAFAPDMGATILDRESVKRWYRGFYQRYTGGKQESGPKGFCQVTGEAGPIPKTHPVKLSLPGGMSVGVALVSYDKPAFESYGLEGTANASIGYEAADGYGLAINALIKKKLPRDVGSSLRVGQSLFLFWTREPAPMDFLEQFESPKPDSVEELIKAPSSGGSDRMASSDVNEFYCLVLSGNAARAVVRDYLEEPLPRVREHVRSWFRDLKIASTNQGDLGHPVATFPLWTLASSMTASKAGGQSDWQRINDLIPQLMSAALRGRPVPDNVLASCLQRLRAEGSRGFRPARMALMKLCLLRKGVPVSEKLNPMESNPAYVCGELLDVFDQIQRAALGVVKATVVDRFYSGFSAAPMTSLGELFKKAQHHLGSLRSENPTRAAALEKRLTLTTSRLKDVPEGQLSFADQARFALGYYHAKADRIERWARAQQDRAEGRRRAAKTTTDPQS